MGLGSLTTEMLSPDMSSLIGPLTGEPSGSRKRAGSLSSAFFSARSARSGFLSAAAALSLFWGKGCEGNAVFWGSR